MLASLRKAESLAQALNDGRRLARVWAHMVSCFWWMGDLESAVDRGRRALATATDLGDLGLEILARARLAMAYVSLGSYQQAIEVGRPCTETLSRNLARDRFGMAALPAVMVRGLPGRKPCEPRRFHRSISVIGRSARDRHDGRPPLQRGSRPFPGGKMAHS